MSQDSSDSEDSDFETRDFVAESELITNSLLPSKSCARYNQVYDEFTKWAHENKAIDFDENTLLVYFNELSKKFKASTLWSQWSMLRTTFNLKHDKDINNFQKLKIFLKNFGKGYKPKKASVFTWEQFNRFLNESDDYIYLSAKVILIFGIFGCLRSKDILSIGTNDVEDTGNQYIVTIKDSKNYYPRQFVIGDHFYQIVKNYVNIRPVGYECDRFFINYQRGKCTRQVIGKNKISEVPKVIACYLNLNDPDSYTGHSLRRTAATVMVNAGANLTALMEFGGWRSSSVAEGYIEHSLANKTKLYSTLVHGNKTSASAPILSLTTVQTSSSTSTPTSLTSVSISSLKFVPISSNTPSSTIVPISSYTSSSTLVPISTSTSAPISSYTSSSTPAPISSYSSSSTPAPISSYTSSSTPAPISSYTSSSTPAPTSSCLTTDQFSKSSVQNISEPYETSLEQPSTSFVNKNISDSNHFSTSVQVKSPIFISKTKNKDIQDIQVGTESPKRRISSKTFKRSCISSNIENEDFLQPNIKIRKCEIHNIVINNYLCEKKK